MKKKVIGIKIDFKVSESGNFVAITKNCLVSVVSIEELEKIGKQLILEDETWYKGKSYIDGINDLLFIVKKQAKAVEK